MKNNKISTESDTNPPTTGIKLPIANLYTTITDKIFITGSKQIPTSKNKPYSSKYIFYKLR